VTQSEPQQLTIADWATLLGHFIRGAGLDIDRRRAVLADAHYLTFGGFFRPTDFLAIRNNRGNVTSTGLAFYERHGDQDRNGRAPLAHRPPQSPTNA
jgi:hypothetical protein